MNAKTSQGASPLDIAKWVVVVAIVAVAVTGNTYFAEEYSPLYRALALIGLAILAGGIAYLTEQGKAFVELLKEARVEAKKVVWPTRAETNQSTLIVAAVVAVMSLILWGLDSLLSYIVKLLLG
jgi:preprotein translocase subunit SecE